MKQGPVFVVGCPRSGSTWLYHILLSAGDFAIYRAETHVFDQVAPCYGDFRSAAERKRFLGRWLASEQFHRSGLEPAHFSHRFEQDCRSGADFLRILLGDIAAQQGASRWAESTPDHSLHVDRILHSFPDALIIHVIRDGRDVALSLGKTGWVAPLPGDDPQDPTIPAFYWEWVVQRCRAQASRLGRSYLEVRFEHLVRQPEAEMERLSEVLGRPMQWDAILRNGIGSVARPNTSFESGGGQKFDPVGRWRTKCSPAVQAKLNGGVGPTLSELGYEVPSSGNERGVSQSLRRSLYRGRFAARAWVSRRPQLARWLLKTDTLNPADTAEPEDILLRPGDCAEEVRRLVRGSAATSG